MEEQMKVEEALTNAIKQLDKGLLRKAKADMFRCSAKCCDDPHMSIAENQRCTEECASKILRIQQLVQDEFLDFQDRLDRAAKTCQDNVRDKMSSDTSTVDRAKYQKQYEDCVSKKVDEHLANLPALIKKLMKEGSKIQSG